MENFDADIIEIAKKIRKVFKDTDFAFVGSTALWLQDIKIKQPHDIDVVPLGITQEEKYKFKRFFNILRTRFSVKLDILITELKGDEYVDVILGDETYKVQTVDTVLKYKEHFANVTQLGEERNKKHRQDLEAILNYIKKGTLE